MPKFYKAFQAMPLHELRSLVPNAPCSFTCDGDRVDGGIVNSEVPQKLFLIYAPYMQQGTITRHQNMLQGNRRRGLRASYGFSLAENALTIARDDATRGDDVHLDAKQFFKFVGHATHVEK